MNKVLIDDIATFVSRFDLADRVQDASFLITGGTGLIGSILTHCLLALNRNVHITLPIRNVEKAFSMFDSKEQKNLTIITTDLISFLENLKEPYDYIVHCASPTAGVYMEEHPAETYTLAIESTRLLLEYMRRYTVQSMIYVSSLEYYGQNMDDRWIKEDFLGYVDTTSSRSCYPLGKRSAEYLCTAYAKEYAVPAKIARPTQTFGAGISPEDNRVFAQFAKSVIRGKDIVLHTTGLSAKPYCYTIDCVSAILYILLRGEKGEAYNVANEDTYISIRDMAYFLRDKFAPDINVQIEQHDNIGYAPITKLHLSTEKLRNLGWKNHYDLTEMYSRLLESIK